MQPKINKLQKKSQINNTGTFPKVPPYFKKKKTGCFFKEYGVRPYPEEAREVKGIKVAILLSRPDTEGTVPEKKQSVPFSIAEELIELRW